MIIVTLEELAANRWFDPVRFLEFARRPENARYLNEDGSVQLEFIDDIVRAYRNEFGKEVLDEDRSVLHQALFDRR